MRFSLLPLLLAGLIGSSAVLPAAAQRGDGGAAWRDVATERDRERLRGWRRTWIEALREARRAGYAESIREEGALVAPDAALPNPAPYPGDYRCRTVKIGGQGELLDWVSYPAFRCRVTRERGGGYALHKLTGSQRPIGRLYPDTPRRMVFLGTLQLGDERGVWRYGDDADRDLAGHFERIGERRWRLVFPRPVFESIVDVLELVPA